MADQKISDITTAATKANLTETALLEILNDPAGTPGDLKTTVAFLRTFVGNGMLDAAGGADAAQTMAVGTMYNVDISGYTADRIYTLPAVAAVGDRCGIHITTGDTAFELIYQAAAGDTLDGVAAAERSRLFIAGETVIFRCVVANATWVTERDGRICQRGLMELTTSADGETLSTLTRPTQAAGTAGVWTSRIDNGSCVLTATDAIQVRRACDANIAIGYIPKDNGTAAEYLACYVRVNGSTTVAQATVGILASAINRAHASKLIVLATDDYVQFQYATQAGNLGALANADTFLSLVEVLK